YLDGTGDRSQVVRLQDIVQQDIAVMDGVDRRLGHTLETTADWKKLKGKWQALQSGAFSLGRQQSLDAYGAFRDDLMTLIGTAGTNSKLILDPDADSYYVMDTVLIQIPQIVADTAQARGLSIGGLRLHTLSAADKRQLAVLSNQITTALG